MCLDAGSDGAHVKIARRDSAALPSKLPPDRLHAAVAIDAPDLAAEPAAHRGPHFPGFDGLRAIAALTVLMVVGHQPMVAVGQPNFLNEILALAHAANIAAAANQGWPRLSVEYIIATRPEVILDGAMGTDPATPNSFWGKYASIPAVKDHRVFGYPEDPTLHPGPRIGLTLEYLARLIHPEAFSDRPAAEAPR